MKTSEVAKVLGVSSMTVRNWAGSGKLKCLSVGSKHKEFDEKEVANFYLNILRNKFLTIQVYKQRLAEIRKYAEKFGEESNLLFHYYQLIQMEIIRQLVKLVGPKNGQLYKLINLHNLSEEEKKICEKIINHISLKTPVIREFRNSVEHDVHNEDKKLKTSVLDDVLDDVKKLFEIMDPDFWLNDVDGAEDLVKDYIIHYALAKRYESLEKLVVFDGDAILTRSIDGSLSAETKNGKKIDFDFNNIFKD